MFSKFATAQEGEEDGKTENISAGLSVLFQISSNFKTFPGINGKWENIAKTRLTLELNLSGAGVDYSYYELSSDGQGLQLETEKERLIVANLSINYTQPFNKTNSLYGGVGGGITFFERPTKNFVKEVGGLSDLGTSMSAQILVGVNIKISKDWYSLEVSRLFNNTPYKGFSIKLFGKVR